MRHSPFIVVALSLPFALSACAKQQEGVSANEPPPAAPAPPQAQRPIPPSQVIAAIDKLPQPDRDFLLQATGANIAAIRIGQLAAQRGESIEVRSLGREMVDTHTALSDQLRQSAATEGITLPIAQMTPEQVKIYEDLSKLSGAKFDKAFRDKVMKIQQETIASFQNEAMNGKVSELAMFANQTLPLLNQRVRTVQNQIRKM
jgi:putative membrane protein